MEFTLKIHLGNDAMKDPHDVAATLKDVAYDLIRNGFVGAGEKARILDVNGNTVGTWGIEE